jgi:hypothetical protein
MNDVPNIARASGLESQFAATHISAALQEHSQAWFRAHTAYSNAAQKIMSTWTKCRHDDASAAISTFQRIFSGKNGGDITAAYKDWFAGSAKRLTAEISNARQESLRLTEIGRQSMRALSLNEAGRMQATGLAVTNFTTSASDTRSNAA